MIGPFMNTVPLRVDLDAGDGPARARPARSRPRCSAPCRTRTHRGTTSSQRSTCNSTEPDALGIGELVFLMDEPVPAEFSAGGLLRDPHPAERIVRRELTVAMSTRDDRITGMVTYDGTLFESRR